MTKIEGSIEVKEIRFLGQGLEPSIVKFDRPVYVLNGASNTGKSFLLESIDYMLGSESIDKIYESLSYDEISLKILLNNKPFTIYRKFPSATFEIYEGYIDSKNNEHFLSYYKTGKASKNIANINDFFSGEMSLLDKEISLNLFAEKGRITIRLLSRVIVTKEEKIISTHSPIEAGDRTENSKNRNVFKFLLTGIDDSEVQTVTRTQDFKSEAKGRTSVLESVIEELTTDLSFPQEPLDSLNEREIKLKQSIDEIAEKIAESQKGLSEVVLRKKGVSKSLMKLNDRLNTLVVNRQNFERLSDIYRADIKRLQSQEEASFLLTVGHDGECALCGNQSELVCNDLIDIDLLSKASIAEIEKIREKEFELDETIVSLDRQRKEVEVNIENLTHSLQELDNKVSDRTRLLNLNDKNVQELRSIRSAISTDVLLCKRIKVFEKKMQELELTTAPKKYGSSEFYPPENTIEDFCTIYSNILKEIKFPGGHNVTFDYKRYDVVIDGNPRHLNGKGVRAILNSIFKIALLKHCREKELFHPGLLILDSPLLTYRDPLKSKYGELDADEEELSKSKLSYRFLNYLDSISDLAQFIVIENIDIPSGLGESVGVETFYGKIDGPGERFGLF